MGSLVPFILTRLRRATGRLLAMGLLAGPWALAGTAQVVQSPWAHGECELIAARVDGVAEAGGARWEWTLMAGAGPGAGSTVGLP